MNIGAKASALEQMSKKGMPVPEFFVISADQSIDLTEIKKSLPAERYVVRSSAQIEDNKESSMAGQFISEINLKLEDIPAAIERVKDQAKGLLKGDLSGLALIIQIYIPADMSGVLFTRSPFGEREMVIEYANTIAQEIVSGKITAKKYKQYWTQDSEKFPELIRYAKEIEELFGHPQDIEWLISKEKLYILQSRPITTIDAKTYKSMKYLDAHLPKKDFLYEKTEISEISEQPSDFTMKLLCEIYQANGPIEKIYKKNGINYQAHDFFKLIDTHLFIDRELELQTLLPAYSYLNRDLKPKISHLKGLFTSMVNLLKLNRIRTDNFKDLEEKLSQALNRDTYDFLTDYELIFEINLRAEKALKYLQTAFKKQAIEISDLITHDFGFKLAKIDYDQKAMLGNSLEIADQSAFQSHVRSLTKNPDVEKYFDGLSKIMQKFYLPIIEAAQQFSRLREYGRHLTVKHISEMRRKEKPHTIKKSEFVFPARLTNIIAEKKQQTQGISSGKVSGFLSEKAQIGAVLYTRILSPELTQHFDQILGIVSEQGGMLSHLAIMAREKGLPVISGFNLSSSNIKIGDQIEIDGSSGSIKKINCN